MNAVDPYSAMVNQVLEEFPLEQMEPGQYRALTNMRDRPATDEDIVQIGNFLEEQGYRNSFLPLVGKIADYINSIEAFKNSLFFTKAILVINNADRNKLFIHHYLSSEFDLENYRGELTLLKSYVFIRFKFMQKIKRFDVRIPVSFVRITQQRLSESLRLLKNLSINTSHLKRLYSPYLIQHLLMPMGNLTLRDHLHCTRILHQFTRLPKEDGEEINPVADFGGENAYNTYKNIYQPFHTLQLANRRQGQPLPPAIVNLIGFYSLITKEKIND